VCLRRLDAALGHCLCDPPSVVAPTAGASDLAPIIAEL
jgi:hypothetical protein